ncbi:DoxX family protein [Flavobacteriaceae bacterium]|nr:DoxX family protein [Flavobacteriaceae bacterium]
MEILEYIVIALKIIVGVSIINVWIIQPNKPSKWRGGDATTIIEEFNVYGLSKTFYKVVFVVKVGLAILLLASIKYDFLTLYSSLGLAGLLLGSIAMHFKVKDALFKSFPAFLFMGLNLIIAYLYI